jgi:hypothetical protein
MWTLPLFKFITITLPKGNTMLKVFVYFNLQKKCFSIKALSGPYKGLVIGHCIRVLLSDVTFKVSPAGRRRVLTERRKNVHAGAVGYIADSGAYDVHDRYMMLGTAITYNPYKYDSFVQRSTEQPVHNAKWAALVAQDGKGFISASL